MPRVLLLLPLLLTLVLAASDLGSIMDPDGITIGDLGSGMDPNG